MGLAFLVVIGLCKKGVVVGVRFGVEMCLLRKERGNGLEKVVIMML